MFVTWVLHLGHIQELAVEMGVYMELPEGEKGLENGEKARITITRVSVAVNAAKSKVKIKECARARVNAFKITKFPSSAPHHTTTVDWVKFPTAPLITDISGTISSSVNCIGRRSF